MRPAVLDQSVSTGGETHAAASSARPQPVDWLVVVTDINPSLDRGQQCSASRLMTEQQQEGMSPSCHLFRCCAASFCAEHRRRGEGKKECPCKLRAMPCHASAHAQLLPSMMSRGARRTITKTSQDTNKMQFLDNSASVFLQPASHVVFSPRLMEKHTIGAHRWCDSH